MLYIKVELKSMSEGPIVGGSHESKGQAMPGELWTINSYQLKSRYVWISNVLPFSYG